MKNSKQHVNMAISCIFSHHMQYLAMHCARMQAFISWCKLLTASLVAKFEEKFQLLELKSLLVLEISCLGCLGRSSLAILTLARFPGSLLEVLKEDHPCSLQIQRSHVPRRLSEVQLLW